MEASFVRGAAAFGTPSKKNVVKESKRLSREILMEYRKIFIENVGIKRTRFREMDMGTPLLDYVTDFCNYLSDTSMCCREWLTAFIDVDLILVLFQVDGVAKREIDNESNRRCAWGKVVRQVLIDILCDRMYRDYIGGVKNCDSVVKDQWERFLDEAKLRGAGRRLRWLYRLEGGKEAHARKYHGEGEREGLVCNARYCREWTGY
jgi:hypothetical protein